MDEYDQPSRAEEILEDEGIDTSVCAEKMLDCTGCFCDCVRVVFASMNLIELRKCVWVPLPKFNPLDHLSCVMFESCVMCHLLNPLDLRHFICFIWQIKRLL